MTLILDGKKARDFYKKALIERVKRLSCVPKLALVQIGENEESSIYIEQKKKFAKSIGADVDHIRFPADASLASISERIKGLNADASVNGIIVQLPLPAHLDKWKIVNLIDPKKDVDGLTDENQALLEKRSPRFVPATAKGVSLLLDFYGISAKNKRAAVFGRSRLVGRPVALLLALRGASVSVIHSQTENPRLVSKEADIVVVAIGKPELVDTTYIKPGAVVIDVGINSVHGEKLEEEMPKRKIIGDVKHNEVAPVASAISPVPGGVGPMTVLSLFDNLISSAEER